MGDAKPGDRRYRPDLPLLIVECRLCWRATDLDRCRFETTDQHVYVRCPHCGGSFPVRQGDWRAFIDRHPLRLVEGDR